MSRSGALLKRSVTASATHRGVDLSHHQDPVDFGTLKSGGVEFVALKATEGSAYSDPTFEDRQARARRVGFHRLAFYHFVRPLDDPRMQALRFARVVGDLRPNELLALDVEPLTDPSRDWSRLSAMAGRNVVISLLETLKGALDLTDGRVLLYGSPGWLRERFGTRLADLTVMPLWAARYSTALGDVSPWSHATVWQDSEHGAAHGAGAPGEVDTDLWLDEGAW